MDLFCGLKSVFGWYFFVFQRLPLAPDTDGATEGGWSKVNPSVDAVYRISGLPDWRFTSTRLGVRQSVKRGVWGVELPTFREVWVRGDAPQISGGFGGRSLPSFGAPRFGRSGGAKPPKFQGAKPPKF